MSKFVWKSLLVGPAALGAVLAVSTSASAVEALANTEAVDLQVTDEIALQAVEEVALDEVVLEEVSAEAIELPAIAEPIEIADSSNLEEIGNYADEAGTAQPQVTSISQFSDVQPTDWAYTALQSLVERYGCIAGYPDGSFRGNRAMTRYEFAAGLNACLDRILEVVTELEGTDLSTINRLLDEFQAELATLRGRVDSLEARVAELEANQFSTTTKLKGQVIAFGSGLIDNDDDGAQLDYFGNAISFEDDDQIQLGYRVRLNFDTSFSGEDRLRTRFQAREAVIADAANATPQTGAFSFDGGGGNDFVLDDLYYEFPVTDWIYAKLGLNSQSGDDWVASTISPVDSASGGTISDFGGPAQYDFDNGDLGFGAIFQLTDNISFDVGYSGADSTSNDGAALFNGEYSLYAQATVLTEFVDFALTYANAYSGQNSGFFGQNLANGQVANVYGGQVNFKFDGFEIGGGVAYAGRIRSIQAAPDTDAWSWQATLALPDFGGEGNLLGALVGMPLRLGNNDNESFLVEGFYKFQVTDNISVTPAVIWIQDPLNDQNDDSVIGAIRTTFSF